MVHTSVVTQKELLWCPGTNTESRRISNSENKPGTAPTSVKHKEECNSRREIDRDNRLRVLTELRKHSHPLTHKSNLMFNIVNGQVVSETGVNVHDAVEIGQDMRTSFA